MEKTKQRKENEELKKEDDLDMVPTKEKKPVAKKF